MRFIAALLLLLSLISPYAGAAPVRDKYVEADLISEDSSIQPGRPFWVGVRLKMDPRWHTYWKNCGDACQPTSIKWTLPDGFTAGDIQWPYPTRFSLSREVVNYAYEGIALLMVQITPPANLPADQPVTLKALVKWLMCSEMCIPGKAELSLTLPVKNEKPAPDFSYAERFESTRAKLPQDIPGWKVGGEISGSNLVLRATPPADFKAEAPGSYFFVETDGFIDYEGKQTLSNENGTLVVTIPLAAKPEIPDKATGVLVIKSDPVLPLKVDLPLKSAVESAPTKNGPENKIVAPQTNTSGLSLWSGLLAMFLGGLILNLMPCVFPVLSLKIVGFVEQAKEGHGTATAHAGAFVAGVMVSMWVLAGILLALRNHGGNQGWAFQMANPHFVLALIFLFLLIGLNMFGVFEIGVGLTGAGGELQAKKGLAGSFFSGLLTTVAGAPCAGPFLGTAIGFALSQSNTVALLSFTAMGLGTAAPYALFSTAPALLRFIPRPGPWMETMKQLMGFPMVATAAWFAATFVKLQGGDNAELRIDSMKSLLFAAVAVAVAAWIFGKWAALHRAIGTRWTARIAALALIAGAGVYAIQKPETVFEPWSPEKIAKLREAGKPVFVDFTAEWCAICQVNKKIIEQPDVLAKFKLKGVTLMIADWTDQNMRVGAGLKEFERDAVPLYLLYGKDGTKPPAILPQALTPGTILDELDKI